MSCSADGGTSGNNVLNDSLVAREGLKICEEPKPEPVELQSAILRLQSRKPSIWRSRGSNGWLRSITQVGKSDAFQAVSQTWRAPSDHAQHTRLLSL
jgi:hypothetical protein